MNSDVQQQNNPQTNDCHDKRLPTLADRFHQLFAEHITPETERFDKNIIGYSIPLRLLRRFSSVSCLNCYLCHSENEYDPPEGAPIFAWSSDYIVFLINVDEYSNATRFSVVSQRWWAQKRGHAPNIEDVGRIIVLEE